MNVFYSSSSSHELIFVLQVFHCVHFECPSQLDEDHPASALPEASNVSSDESTAAVAPPRSSSVPSNASSGNSSNVSKSRETKSVEPSANVPVAVQPQRPHSVENEEPSIFARFVNEPEIQEADASFE